MAQRFYDTAIWAKTWFRKLGPVGIAAWQYINAHCDSVGVWDHDTEAAEFYIGASLDWDAFAESCNGNIERLPSGKWWLLDFCGFQYGPLKESCKPHISYLKSLEKHGLLCRFVDLGKGLIIERIPLPNPMLRVKEKEKEKEQAQEEEIEIEKDQEQEARAPEPTLGTSEPSPSIRNERPGLTTPFNTILLEEWAKLPKGVIQPYGANGTQVLSQDFIAAIGAIHSKNITPTDALKCIQNYRATLCGEVPGAWYTAKSGLGAFFKGDAWQRFLPSAWPESVRDEIKPNADAQREAEIEAAINSPEVLAAFRKE